MRLWSFHPKYLDAKGLVAAWREALLAKKVLQGRTRGYRHHPQLERFRQSNSPIGHINAYLRELAAEADRRGYHFDTRKAGRHSARTSILVTSGQIAYEWKRFRAKLRSRDPRHLKKLQPIAMPETHTVFAVMPGPIAAWERIVD